MPPEFRGREPDLVNAVASALAEVRIGRSVRLERLGPVNITASKGQSVADVGRAVAKGIVAGLPANNAGGDDD